MKSNGQSNGKVTNGRNDLPSSEGAETRTGKRARILIVEDEPAMVARADWGGRGRTSGIDLLSSLTSIYTFRDGRIVKVEWFFDHAKALEAVGLSEQDAHAE